MTLAVSSKLPPMEAQSVDAVPEGDNWQYEPKWDGFRCLAFREQGKILLQSKSGQPLARYFPDIVAALRSLGAKQFVLDGEIVIPIRRRFSFDELLMRIHPAESRVQMLAAKHPAMFVLFDLLANERGTSLVELPLHQRRRRLENFAAKYLVSSASLKLSPATLDGKTAKKWLGTAGGNLDGIMAKRLDVPYRAGLRDGMQKIKPHRTADCVVGGFRHQSGKTIIGSLLLGLYDDEGLLNHVGFTSSFSAAERVKITKRVKSLVAEPGFTGRSPGGPSRWSTSRSNDWQPVRPNLVLEVLYDHFTGGRFRHGTKFLRWRPDKLPNPALLSR